MSKTLKGRFLALVLSLVAILSIFPATPAFAAENLNGGWGYAPSTTNVYSTMNLTNKSGSL